MKLELNLTEQLFASLSRRCAPSFFVRLTPSTPNPTPKTRFVLSNSPRPWATSPSATKSIPTIGATIRAADRGTNCRSTLLTHLPPCAPNDRFCGSIILLHDGGGNRSQTVFAVPMIIEGARAKGLQIVPVYQLLGKTRADVMPPSLPTNAGPHASLGLASGYSMLALGSSPGFSSSATYS